MTRYDSVPPRPSVQTRGPHPIWRGIGCLTMIIVPLIAFAISRALIDLALSSGWPVPTALLGSPGLPDWLRSVPVLYTLLAPVRTWTNLYAYLALAAILTLLIGGVMSFAYSVIYAMIGPPRWGPLDIPPPKGVKIKSYKR